jgi:ABC-type glycerol-3-phosphate transport system substrate-binding protein
MRRLLRPFQGCFFAALLILCLYGSAAACVAPPVATQPEAQLTELPVITEEPTATQPPQTTGAQVKVEMWLSLNANSEEYAQALIEEFQTLNPDIVVTLVFIPYPDFLNKLITAAAAGTPPSVAAISYNFIATLQGAGYLLPLQTVGSFPWQEYLPDALNNVNINDTFYALPWQRYACAPGYLNLALFRQEDQTLQASLRLLEFLNRPDQQERNYREVGWYPTLTQVYESLGISCPPVVTLRPPPGAVPEIITQSEQDARLIQQQFDLVVNAADATAYFGSYETPAARAAAVLSTPNEEEAKRLLDSDGLAVGALFVDQPIQVQAGLTAGFQPVSRSLQQVTVFPAGDYKVECTMNPPGGLCRLTDLSGNVIEVVPEVAESTSATPSQPVCSLEEGSRRFCWNVDGVRFCIRVG